MSVRPAPVPGSVVVLAVRWLLTGAVGSRLALKHGVIVRARAVGAMVVHAVIVTGRGVCRRADGRRMPGMRVTDGRRGLRTVRMRAGLPCHPFVGVAP